MALANSGDSVEDANFETSVAEAGVLRLWTFLELAKELLLQERGAMRPEGAEHSINDRMFLAEMDLKIRETDQHLAAMLFKEALRTGFYEYSNLFHQYRERCSVGQQAVAGGGMHWGVVERYLSTQLLLLAPFCPHVCDHAWRNLLQKDTSSILRAAWPAASAEEPDMALIKASAYLGDATHRFRLRLKAHTATPSGGKGKKGPDAAKGDALKPSHGVIWVAKSFPAWQSSILETMLELYKAHGGQLPDNKVISKALGAKQGLKKYMKKAMPFAQAVRERMEASGLGEAALSATVDFDERGVLEENLELVRSSLELEGVEVRWSEECDVERTREEVVPGEPFLTLSTWPSVSVKLVNPQPQLGLFNCLVPVYAGDSVAHLAHRLRRLERGLRPSMDVTLRR